MKKLLIIAILLVTTQVNAKISIVPDPDYYNYNTVWALMDMGEKHLDDKDYKNSCTVYTEMEHIVKIIFTISKKISGTEIMTQDRIEKIKAIACSRALEGTDV